MPCWIIQCYLPPGRNDIPALIPAEAGIWLSDPGGKQGWVDPVWVNFVHATNGANHVVANLYECPCIIVACFSAAYCLCFAHCISCSGLHVCSWTLCSQLCLTVNMHWSLYQTRLLKSMLYCSLSTGIISATVMVGTGSIAATGEISQSYSPGGTYVHIV